MDAKTRLLKSLESIAPLVIALMFSRLMSRFPRASLDGSDWRQLPIVAPAPWTSISFLIPYLRATKRGVDGLPACQHKHTARHVQSSIPIGGPRVPGYHGPVVFLAGQVSVWHAALARGLLNQQNVAVASMDFVVLLLVECLEVVQRNLRKHERTRRRNCQLRGMRAITNTHKIVGSVPVG